MQKTLSDSEGTAFQEKELRQLLEASRNIPATIWIGKRGTAKELLNHIEKELESHELVKLRVHRSALQEQSMRILAENVSSSTGSVLVQIIGHTFTLYKRRKNKEGTLKRR